MQSVVVTGVSTGIGYGCARVLTSKGLRVFGSVRRPEDALRLQAELGPLFVPLTFDVTDEAAVAAAAAEVARQLMGAPLLGLVNNAGVAVAGPLLHLPVADLRRQLEVNVTGVVISTQAFAPLLGARRGASGRRGRIVNIGSVGGRTATPFMGPYCASKFAIEGLSDSLRRELMIFGVDVILIAPGAVATAIWGKADEVDVAPYAGTAFHEPLGRVRAYMRTIADKALPPERLGAVVHHALTTPRPRPHYTVTPDPFRTFLGETLPKRLFDRMTARLLGLTPAAG